MPLPSGCFIPMAGPKAIPSSIFWLPDSVFSCIGCRQSHRAQGVGQSRVCAYSYTAAASRGIMISWWPVMAYPRPPDSTGRRTTFTPGR
jgi:hypothetical protein